MGTQSFIGWQFGMTLIAVLAVAIFLYMRIRRRQRHDAEARRAGQPEKHSALADTAHLREPHPSRPRRTG